MEHEYTLTEGPDRIDFRRLIHGLAVPGLRLDPGDTNAYRCRSGMVLTCDDEDAEVVSPPVPVRPGFALDVADWGARGAVELRRILPPGIGMRGFSTHLSASLPPRLVGPVCALLAETFAPALMLVLDRADSHGVFLRPRPGRVELCGEFATGARLGAAAALVAGGTRACAGALARDGLSREGLPPALAVDLRPATGRFGLFVGRRLAFGFDLYAAGRRARLPLEDGGVITAQAHLERAWSAARAALADAAGPADLDAGDRIVAGSSPLGVESADGDAPHPPRPAPPSPCGGILGSRRRPGVDVVAVAATWDFTVFRLDHGRRTAYACIPTPWLEQFLDRLDSGDLDVILARFLDAAPAGRVLVAHDQTGEPGLWDDAVIGPDLLPYERTVADGDLRVTRPVPARPGKVAVVAPGPPAPAAAASSPGDTVVVPTRVEAGPAAGGPPPAPLAVGPRSPVGGRRRGRRRIRVLAVLFGVLLAAGLAAWAGGLVGGGGPVVEVRTSPPPPPPPPPTTVFREPATSVAVTSAPDEPTSTAAPTTAAATTPVPRPTAGATAAPATEPPTTVVPTTVPSTTVTTVVINPPTDVLVGVAEGVTGCAFQPSSITVVMGSTVAFRNDADAEVTIVIGETTIMLDSGGVSGPYLLATAGAYGATCALGAGGVTGGMTITVTGG
ncbi:MAG: hypothetical protein QOG43_427 [Actinomycetota bacterium]|nr:hypothetical protein [Actinomycetota bacterium]